MIYIMFTSYEIPGIYIYIYKWQTLNSKIVMLPKEKRTGLKHNESAKLVEIYKLNLLKLRLLIILEIMAHFAYYHMTYHKKYIKFNLKKWWG